MRETLCVASAGRGVSAEKLPAVPNHFEKSPHASCAHRAVQIFGGRGYMREQPVERLFRDLRVDRIWEGTSEVQRMILGRELHKRGPEAFTNWPT